MDSKYDVLGMDRNEIMLIDVQLYSSRRLI